MTFTRRQVEIRLMLGDALTRRSAPLRADEHWLPVPDHAGLYEVSSLGRVRSLYFNPPKLLKFGTDETGYPTVMLTKDGRRKPYTVHRLVCRAFHGEPGPLKREAAHLDGSTANARADNLKWVSRTENEQHKYAHGTKSPERYGKLTEAQVRQIKSLLGTKSHAAIARELGIVKADAVSKIARGLTWRDTASAAIPLTVAFGIAFLCATGGAL